MRLLNTTTGEFKIVHDPRNVRYAILSHCWPRKRGAEREMEYAEVREIQEAHRQRFDPLNKLSTKFQQVYDVAMGREVQKAHSQNNELLKRLSKKIQNACKLARKHGYTYIWIDSCCIDNTSSSELSEAINSMFTWYRWANVCYAFLHDVLDTDRPSLPDSHFRKSEWHKRGWTLQELIAPRTVIFLSQSWKPIDTKHGLANVISDITSIDASILTNLRSSEDVCVAERMSWAAGRRTSRVEDRAYCLVGILGVFVSPLYGEGEYAFIRLQEAILKALPDQSIFVWGARYRCLSLDFLHDPERIDSKRVKLAVPLSSPPGQAARQTYILASSPNDFKRFPKITNISLDELSESLGLSCLESHRRGYDFTSYGIRTTFPVVQFSVRGRKFCLAFLTCMDTTGDFLALLLRSESDTQAPTVEYSVGEQQGQDTFPFPPVASRSPENHVRLVAISGQGIRGQSARGTSTKVFHDSLFVRHRASTQRVPSLPDPLRASILHIKVSHIPMITIDRSCVAVLLRKGYNIEDGKGPGRVRLSVGKLAPITLTKRRSDKLYVLIGLCRAQCGGVKYEFDLCAGVMTGSKVMGDGEVWHLSAPSGDQQADGGESRRRHSKTTGHPTHWHVLHQWNIEGGIATQTFRAPQKTRSRGAVDERLQLTLTWDRLREAYILGIDAFEDAPSPAPQPSSHEPSSQPHTRESETHHTTVSMHSPVTPVTPRYASNPPSDIDVSKDPPTYRPYSDRPRSLSHTRKPEVRYTTGSVPPHRPSPPHASSSRSDKKLTRRLSK